MSKHTPGPWIGAGPSFGDRLPRYTTEIVTEYEYEDGEVRSICELPFAHHDDENEANARLIAAAPELLEALKDARRKLAWFTDSYPQDIVVSESEFFEPIDAAIAKAEGQ